MTRKNIETNSYAVLYYITKQIRLENKLKKPKATTSMYLLTWHTVAKTKLSDKLAHDCGGHLGWRASFIPKGYPINISSPKFSSK